jgi:signal transduction histidine kinase
MRSLRTKLVIANILPILLMMPLLSLYLLYSLEELFTQKMLQQLTQQAELLNNQVQTTPELMEDAQTAQQFLAGVAPHMDARVMLLSQAGTIVASTRVEDQKLIGMQDSFPMMQQVLQGVPARGTGPGFASEVAYIALPVRNQGVPRGVLRLSYAMDDVRTEFAELRHLVLGGVGLTALLALGIGLALATTITGPLHQLTRAIREIATGEYRSRVAIKRQDEIGNLAHSFNQMASRINEAEVVRQRQLAAIVHELARPLTGMRAAVETILESTTDDTDIRNDLLTGIDEELARLERLLGTLQRFDKQVVYPLTVNRSKVALPHVIHASVSNFERAATQLGIRLICTLPANLPDLCVDEDRLIQVLTNLLDNSLKFTPPGGSITVEAEEQTDVVQVCVTDSGNGIEKDELPNLFQQFYRGADSRPPEKRGMGLGLSICREIIAAHGQKIWVESEPGQGTRVAFTLPKAKFATSTHESTYEACDGIASVPPT